MADSTQDACTIGNHLFVATHTANARAHGLYACGSLPLSPVVAVASSLSPQRPYTTYSMLKKNL
eukprot:scaffold10073_cov136-Isochrysis_galbana.AAC.13